jgi:gliding motility-associated-like protein
LPNCEAITDSLYWSIPDSCGFDVATFTLYHAPVSSQQYEQVASIPVGALSYVYGGVASVAGCYYITATDSTGNVGAASDTLCIETCPVYVLPNVFSPDGNNINDEFTPFHPYRDVKDVDMTIYNRWGSIMFKTSDPEIHWNGRKDNTGQDAPEGVYYYLCIVNEYTLSGTHQRLLKGFLHLMRGH